MNHSATSTQIRQHVQRQLIALEEEKQAFLDAVFPAFGDKRTQAEQIVTRYSSCIRELLNLPDDQLCKVILIGSQVRITYLEDHDMDSFTIVYPQHAEPNENRISFLSPMGRQLLTATIGSILTIDTPAGTIDIRIDKVTFTAEDIEGGCQHER
ncbi:GreA/GreB family elongation factor [Paenibacillus sp. ACRRX]|uniref:GreA/GreB family elongation factor n=1 Tax=unclassified Paenibacillus TaxID=185978 RepID=UPI001EF52AA7|nr:MULTISPECIES: GreA/GreB family elongation factor [unclassified Paenibacillus]MCG7410245.1 GreA/GreB family elongation factor [Paenibacillus sp. ACRRX]MDK8181074.1 GreA/GreB family elongation factor [Paenibacillus sp. UMB4589-SE434]